MDKERQIRFLYPPLIFMCSLIIEVLIDGSNKGIDILTNITKNSNTTSILVTILGFSSLLLVLGFLFGTITIFILRLLFVRNKFNYEIKLRKGANTDLQKILFSNSLEKVRKKERLYAGVYFDHSCIPDGVHMWIVRRWNAFLISCTSVFALITCIVFVLAMGLEIFCTWIMANIFFILLFVYQAIFSWKETMGMIEFSVKVHKDKSKEITQ